MAFIALSVRFFFFFFNDTATTEIYTLSLHDALPISRAAAAGAGRSRGARQEPPGAVPARRRRARQRAQARATRHRGSQPRSEEHTSELQSPCNLVCRLLLEKKKKKGKTAQGRPAHPL